MVSTYTLISKLPSLFINPLCIVPSAPITIGITFTFMFHSFFNSLARSRYLSLFLLSFYFHFTLRSAGSASPPVGFLFYWWWLGLVIWPRLNHWFLYQNPKEVCASHLPEQILLYIYHLFVSLNMNLLHYSYLITLPTQSFLVLYSSRTNLLHLLFI